MTHAVVPLCVAGVNTTGSCTTGSCVSRFAQLEWIDGPRAGRISTKQVSPVVAGAGPRTEVTRPASSSAAKEGALFVVSGGPGVRVAEGPVSPKSPPSP